MKCVPTPTLKCSTRSQNISKKSNLVQSRQKRGNNNKYVGINNKIQVAATRQVQVKT